MQSTPQSSAGPAKKPPENQRNYVLVSADKKWFPEVDIKVVEMMGMARQMLNIMNLSNISRGPAHEGGDDDNVLKFEYVDKNSLDYVIRWCNRYKNVPRKMPEEIRALRTAPVPVWDAKLLSQLKQSQLFALLMAANYLDIPELVDVCCRTVAQMLKGKTPAQIREEFGVQDDMDEDERTIANKEYMALHIKAPAVPAFKHNMTLPSDNPEK